MAEEYEKYAVMRNLFRRRSSTEFTGAGFNQVLETRQVASMLNEMGFRGNQMELQKTIEQVDGGQTGKLTFEQYQQLCDRFVKDTTNSRTAHLLKGYSDFDS